VRAALAAVVVVAAAALVLVVTVGFAGSGSGPAESDATLGKQLLVAFGCGGCHRISGISQADGRVGPSLHGLAYRRVIAGSLPNTPENVARWIADPKAVDPNTLMPDLGVTRTEAQAITDYLYAH